MEGMFEAGGLDSPTNFVGVFVIHYNSDTRGWRSGRVGPCSHTQVARNIWEVRLQAIPETALLLKLVAILSEGRVRLPESETNDTTSSPTTQTSLGVCPRLGRSQPRSLGCLRAVSSLSSPRP